MITNEFGFSSLVMRPPESKAATALVPVPKGPPSPPACAAPCAAPCAPPRAVCWLRVVCVRLEDELLELDPTPIHQVLSQTLLNSRMPRLLHEMQAVRAKPAGG